MAVAVVVVKCVFLASSLCLQPGKLTEKTD